MYLSNWRSSSKLPIYETDMIIEHVCGFDKVRIILDGSKYLLNDAQLTELNRIHNARYYDKYPLQYLFGYAYFMGMRFIVSPNVLIPRPDTEILAEQAETCINLFLSNNPLQSCKVLDLCTGSGCIGIYLAKKFAESSFVQVVASDISVLAIDVAKDNNRLHNTNVDFVLSDLFESPKLKYEKFDVIVSNPPYISFDEKLYMSEDTLNHEPEIALYANDNGMDIYKRISEIYKCHLNPAGHLLMEIGFNQSERILSLFNDSEKVEFTKDFNGFNRVVHVFN